MKLLSIHSHMMSPIGLINLDNILSFSLRQTMKAMIPLVVFINLAMCHHRMGRTEQTDRFLKPKTGFVKI